MKYMLMIMDRAESWDEESEEQVAALMEEHVAFEQFLKERGDVISSLALEAPGTATSVRNVPGGDGFAITDGPFVDLKEHLGGYYVIEATDLDDAIAVAKRCPASLGIEIRPVMMIA